MSNGDDLLARIVKSYGGFCQYRDVFTSSLSETVGDSLDTSLVTRRYITTFSKGNGFRIEHMHCIDGECSLRRIVIWNYSRAFVWRNGRGWENVNGLQSALGVAKVLTPYLLLELTSPVLQYLGLNEVVAQRSERVRNVECDVLDITRVGGAQMRLWADQHDSIVRQVEWSFPIADSYGGSQGNAQTDRLSEFSTEFEVDCTIFLPIGDGNGGRSI